MEPGLLHNALAQIISGMLCLVALTIFHSGVNIAGETYALQCFANGTNDVREFQWLDEQGSPVTGRESGMISSSNSNGSQLQLSPLHQSHGGTYTCSVIIAGTVRSESTSLSVNGMYSLANKSTRNYKFCK